MKDDHRSQLEAFARAMVEEYHPGQEGFQEIAEEHGIIVPETRTKFCAMGCNCVGMVDLCEPFTCYRLADWLREDDTKSPP